MKIVHLNREKVLANIDRLIEIDKIISDDSWTVDNFLMDLDHKWEFSLIALENDQIIGFLICSTKENNLHIHRIAVSLECQRKKVGSALIAHLLADCYKSHINSITLKVRDFNTNAQRFYEKLEFKKKESRGSRCQYKKELQ